MSQRALKRAGGVRLRRPGAAGGDTADAHPDHGQRRGNRREVARDVTDAVGVRAPSCVYVSAARPRYEVPQDHGALGRADLISGVDALVEVAVPEASMRRGL